MANQERNQSAGELAEANTEQAPAAPLLNFGYVNYRGEAAERSVAPVRLYYGSTEHHADPQWLLEAIDPGKGAVRHFALKDMTFTPRPVEPASMPASADWSDEQVADFLSVALRHVEVRGTLHTQDIRDALQYMKGKHA